MLDKWNEIKKQLSIKEKIFSFKERDIFWIHIGENIGYETNGKNKLFLRPVLILKKFSQKTFLGIPLTTAMKNDRFHYEFNYKKDKVSYANLSQIKLFDAKRIHDKDGRIIIEDFIKLKIKLKELINL